MPLTKSTQTFQACHLCTFDVAAIFRGPSPTYGVVPYAMIASWIFPQITIELGYQAQIVI